MMRWWMCMLSVRDHSICEWLILILLPCTGMCMLEMATGEYPYSECSGPAQIYKKVSSGVPPLSLSKVEQPEVRQIIDMCIRVAKEERPTVKDLLAHDFFQEDTGFKVEFVNRDDAVDSYDSQVELRVRVTDPKKRKDKYKENEALQFGFNFDKESVEDVAKALVSRCLSFFISISHETIHK